MTETFTEEKRWFAGIDLGQSQDHTAVVILERATTGGDRDPLTCMPSTETTYNVRHLERMKLGTPYQAVVERIRVMVEAPALAGNVTLVVDATGVGGPVVDLLKVAIKRAPIVPVIITGGDRQHYQDGRYRVPEAGPGVRSNGAAGIGKAADLAAVAGSPNADKRAAEHAGENLARRS